MKKIVLSMLMLGISACTHLQSVSTSSVPVERSKMVSAEGSRFMFMLFNFDNKYVDSVATDLARQCPGGKIEGILTKYETTTYFPLIFYKLQASASGYCVTQNGKH